LVGYANLTAEGFTKSTVQVARPILPPNQYLIQAPSLVEKYNFSQNSFPDNVCPYLNELSAGTQI